MSEEKKEKKKEEQAPKGLELEIKVEELRKRKVFVATPMYGGQCAGQYTKSCIDLTKMAAKYGVTLDFFYLFNESLVTRARNYCVDEFMRNENYTHFMFIDSDIGFDPNDVMALTALADPNSEYDILCGPYPKKTIAWEKIKAAVDRGYADENPNNLRNFVGDYVFNPAKGQTKIFLHQPVEVLEGGTGFMMVQRHAFERFAAAYPEYLYTPDHVRTNNFDGSRQITQYFQAEIDPKSNRYLSEDYWFSQKAQEIGLKCWLCPWMRLVHIGTYFFGGSLMDLASIGAAATADPSLNIKQ